MKIIGELKQSVRRNFKLPDYTATFSLDLNKLQALLSDDRQHNYQPLSRFPSISQDISLRSKSDTTYHDLLQMVQRILEESKGLHCSIKTLGVYQPENADTKTVTFRITFTSYKQTLTDAKVKPIMDSIATAAITEFDAERV